MVEVLRIWVLLLLILYFRQDPTGELSTSTSKREEEGGERSE